MPHYEVTKTYTPEEGLSCCFRQHKAESHCSKLHGYAIGVSITFAATKLSPFGWVVDFGGLKIVKAMLHTLFDHKTLIAVDDPQRHVFERLAAGGAVDLVVVPAVGCEAFAEHIHGRVSRWLREVDNLPDMMLSVSSVTVFEHGGNSATYTA